MKCQNLVEGELCGAELSLSTKFCSKCGIKVQNKEENNESIPCPKCKSLVTKRQQFCEECGWKIDPSIFESKKIVCAGTKDNGSKCDEDLLPHIKFCGTCGTIRKKPAADNPVPTFEPDTSPDNQGRAESQTDEQGQQLKQSHNHPVSENSFNGNTPASESSTKNVNSDNVQSKVERVFGVGKQQEDNIQQDLTYNLATLNQGILSDSLIFGKMNSNTTPENTSGNQEKGTTESCSSDITTNKGTSNVNVDNTNTDDEFSDSSINSGSVTSTADVEDSQTAKNNRPGKKARDRGKKQLERQTNMGDSKDQVEDTSENNDHFKSLTKEEKNAIDETNMTTSSKEGQQTGTSLEENIAKESKHGKEGDIIKQSKAGVEKSNDNKSDANETTNQSNLNSKSKQIGSESSKGMANSDSVQQKIYSDVASGRLQSNVTENCTTICFHAIFSPSILNQENNDVACILIGYLKNGYYTDTINHMVLDRKLKNGFIRYRMVLNLEWNIIQSGYTYTYSVLKNGDHENIIREHLAYKGSLSKPGQRRTLQLVCGNDIYHSYDGVVREYPDTQNKNCFLAWKDSVFDQFGLLEKYRKVLGNDAKMSIEAFHPTWQLRSFNSDGINGQEIISHIRYIVSGVRQAYVRTAALWSHEDFDQMAAKVLLPLVEDMIMNLNTTKKETLDDEGKILHFVSAVSLACIVDENKINLNQEYCAMLCEDLLPYSDQKNKRLPDFDGLEIYFSETDFSYVGHDVLKFSRKIAKKESKHKKDPCWLFCVPVIHFLLKKCRPFEEAEVNVDHANPTPKWWGVDIFDKDNDRFQEKCCPWERPINEMLSRLEPYFKIDYFLPRTFMTTLKLKEIAAWVPTGHIPLEAILATIAYYLKMGKDEFLKFEKKIISLITYVANCCLKEEPELTLGNLKKIWRIYTIALDVFKESQEWKYRNREIHISAFEVFLINLDLFDKIFEGLKEKNVDEKHMRFRDNHMCLIKKVQTTFIDWVYEEQFYKDELQYLKRWNSALNIRVGDGKIQCNFFNYAEERFRSALKEKNADGKITEIYCKHFDEFSGKLQEILGIFAFKAVENSVTFSLGRLQDETQQKRYGQLLSDVFVAKAKEAKLSSPHEQLAHIMSFAPFSTYVDMHRHLKEHLTKDCQHLLTKFLKLLEDVVAELLSGHIMVSDLKCILNRGDSFKKVVSMIESLNKEAVVSALTLRQTELKLFEKTKSDIMTFVGYCMHCQADVSALQMKLTKLEKVDGCHLNELVHTITQDERESKHQYTPTIQTFGLSEAELEMLPNINEHCQSLIFMKLWRKKGTELNQEKSHTLSVNDVLEEVWIPTLEQYTSLCQKFKSGDIHFSEFDIFFKKTNTDEIKHELELIAANKGNDEWIKERINQVENYRNLKNFKLGAAAILEVVTEFELEGNFIQIQNILQLTKSTDTSMNTLDHSLLDTCSLLTEVTEEKANCLKTFVKCKPLVQWLRGSMSNGLKELKVFVDLASISAGEGDMEIDKVNCLHSATTGYAPLIFNLQKECDTNVFLEKCQEVWKEFAADPQLPRKLIDTNRQLEWLKMVEKSHGSVEVSSLTQTEAINSRGVYKVGNLKEKICIEKPCLAEVLELRVTEEDGETLQRNYYTYEQLHDLQSRLMLVAGKAEKGKDDVDRFMLILDSVVRLGHVFTKLVADGCVLFTQWHVKFLCDRSRPACAFLNFGYAENTHTIKGRVDERNEDVSSIIPQLAKFLEECHEKWLDFITQQRDKYFLLNFYTVDQMVILQQELAKVGSNEEPSDLIYPLLSSIKQGCSKENLLAALKLAKSDVIACDSVEKSSKEGENTSQQAEAFHGEQSLNDKEFLDYITKAGYHLELAKKALQHVGADNRKTGINWCVENEDDFRPEEQENIGSSADNETDTPFSGWEQTDRSLVSVTADLVGELGNHSQERSTETLKTDLKKLWDIFLNSVTSSVSDYLSVGHLALILNRLSEQETFEVERSLLPCFKEGEPNLIVCPQSEIFNTVLSVYSHEADRPLPQSDEVLLCTQHTTLDMLEIFWRRALFADNHKVHCLVNADLLDYEVSDKGEKSLERHMKNAESKGKMFKLVIICSSENEYKSRIVAVLDKYHRPQLPTDVSTVRKYLLTQFKINNTLAEMKPASSVDFERCSVRVVKSLRAGVGKTLFKKRMISKLERLSTHLERQKSADITIPLHEKSISTDNIMNTLLLETVPPKCQEPRIFHIDISHEVQDGVDTFLFQLLILGCLGHSSGYVWRKSELDYYIIESMPLLGRDSDMQGEKLKCIHHCLDILPEIICRSPQESLDILNGGNYPINYTPHDRLFDPEEFKSDVFQRPYQYLMRLDSNRKLHDVNPDIPEGERNQCLETLLRHCGIRDPSWSELHHFVSFLNKQLKDFEISAYCGEAAEEDLPGFAKFVLRFLIQMSRDFSTRSLNLSEESPLQLLERQATETEEGDNQDNIIQLYQMRRTWETSPHPYLFFNPDQNTMTFLGFNIGKSTGNLIDLQTKRILEQNIMQKKLFDALIRNRVDLTENFDTLPRVQKIEKLCNVMGQIFLHDPDETYELTTDNAKKMLAIYMRFRCEIPVIIMGETGCGKTRLIKFMCSLQKPPGARVRNMILMKVHGGTKTSDIAKKVRKAEEISKKNATEYKNMDTVLFFDEANTTEAIGVIKEVMCDKSLEGRPIKLHERLKIVAACNPYRKHSEEFIKRLEQAGLGYHVDADKTADRLGRVPMRRLVYRVQPLPQSMLPLVWDFGQLDTEVEELYIRQMVLRYINNNKLPYFHRLDRVTSRILTVSQQFMRDQKDECSFVSLRDVERVLEVMTWFYGQRDKNLLFQQMNAKLVDDRTENNKGDDEEEGEEAENGRQIKTPLNDVTRSLVLALGVCYHACLKNRDKYRDTVARYFTPPLQLPGGADQLEEEISSCQSVFLDNVDLANNIARNQALKENVFMMVVCVELRIPMFLVGKPGSSKSLAKTIVADAMQGNAAYKDLFKNYKQIQMVSFQCSPLSTPDGIVGTFKQCAAYQKDKNLARFASVVVLDEIGLAEDSPRMPLKTLHPLLEDGCLDEEEKEMKNTSSGIEESKQKHLSSSIEQNEPDENRPPEDEQQPDKSSCNQDDHDENRKPDVEEKKDDCFDIEKPMPHKKVAFIGISNWALDPAKMNRGIIVQREVPDKTELINSAHGICSTDDDVLNILKPMFEPLAVSYLQLFEDSTEMREFFGLRDFYSLVKMLYAFVKKSGKKPTWPQLKHAVLRNFGGLENVEPVDVFDKNLSTFIIRNQQSTENDPDCTSAGMIQACIIGDNRTDRESRYLLLLTENYGALSILQQKIITMGNVQVIFGSSFPSDQEYTQVCRNINRVKVCMETGSTVILLNLENIYESLYDALNQYYVRFGGEKYVDLGLGTHRVKCRVHEQFRLIVVAEKQIVYDKFPIPLINRLEKHFLSLKTMLTQTQRDLAEKLQKWAQDLCQDRTPAHYGQKKDIRKIGDAFMGYHADTCAAIILHVCQEKRCDDESIPRMETEILTEAQSVIVWCATPAVVWEQDIGIFSLYFRKQHHDSLADYLHYKLVEQHQHNLHAQITTHSKLLSTADLDDLCQCIPIARQNITLLTLQSFDTEQQFSRKIKSCLNQSSTTDILLIVQCDCGDQNADLIACARYTVQGELQQQAHSNMHVHVVFLVQLPGIAGGCFTGFQCGVWHSVHIDDFHPSPEDIPSVADMHGKSVSALLIPSGETIDKTDMMREQENVGETDEKNEDIVQPKRHFDIYNLIQKCVQPALAKVKDTEKDSSRGTERLILLHKLLQPSSGIAERLLAGLSLHLTNILKEKEQITSGHLSASWLSSETSKVEKINKAGTFRRFAVQSLHSRVIPILAGVIAFIDTNRNCSIVTRYPPQSWQVDLWLNILNNSEVTMLKYENIVSPRRHTELQEFIVKSTSVEGKVFSAAMPFSWLIHRHIDEILRTTKESEEFKFMETGKHFEIVMKASEIFGELHLGKILDSIAETDSLDIIRLYVSDFVHMVYPAQTEDECKLVCEIMIIGCKQLIKGEFQRLIPSLFGCHMTYNLYAAQFKNFSSMVNAWPECSKIVLTSHQSESLCLVTDDEITLDVLALHLLVKTLNIENYQLDTERGRKKWLRQVYDYRPIVERILGLDRLFFARCSWSIQETRCEWTRVIVLKLYIEHMLTSIDEDISQALLCKPLWSILDTNADMKSIQTLDSMDAFLRSCNKKEVTQCFGKHVCKRCESALQGAPVILPCEHILCRKCFKEITTSFAEYECPHCHDKFPEEFDPDVTSINRVKIRKYQDYRRKCNNFFMEVVSQLCFAERTPPSEEVINKLLSYITGHTRQGWTVVSRELTIFDDSLDPTPVVRSFLLQQIMQTSGKKVDEYLETYFDHTSMLFGEKGQEHLLELCLLILQCLEDSYHQQNSRRSMTHGNLHYDEIIVVKDLLQYAKICSAEIRILDKIKYIASTRFALSVVAKYIHYMYGSKQGKIKINASIREMFSEAAQLCDNCNSPWPRRYFVKHLCRCYSIDSYYSVLTLKDVSFLNWAHLPQIEIEKVNNCFDRYIICEEEYIDIRVAIVELMMNDSDIQLVPILQKSQNNWQTRIRLMLALHRKITMRHVGEDQKIFKEAQIFLEKFVNNNEALITNMELTKHVLDNRIWKSFPDRNIYPDMDLSQQNITCLLMHFLILMKEIPGKTTLVTPLQTLSLQPTNMANSYFPTMPEDEVADVKEALLAARKTNYSENPVFFRCPDGHPYVIGNCGRPSYEGNCNVCGKQIGGKRHVLRADNKQDEGTDQTETGHILERATQLGPIVAPERNLNRASFALLRLLTHMSMYIGADTNLPALCALIKPEMEEIEVPNFLMEHIDYDMNMVQNALGINKDDALVLMHYILSQIMVLHTMTVIAAVVPDDVCGLTSREGRANWEEHFVAKYITPVIQDMDNILTTWNERILNDRRLEFDHLLQLLYETDQFDKLQSIENLQEIPAVWRYKARISVDHLMQTLNTSNQICPILRLFLKEEYHLRAIRFVPSILQLQKLLIQKYNKKLDRAESNALKIEDVKNDLGQDGKLDEFKALLEDFKKAWECVRESLENYVCPSNETLLTVNREYCRTRITDSTPVSYLLPTYTHSGLCSYVLLFFLLDKQNVFLQNYCQESKLRYDALPTVRMGEISTAHLISYHPDKDLLPMVLANCNYSFEVGQVTRVEYNFGSLERQLMDRFLFSKSVIEDMQEIETYIFRAESTNALVFKTLSYRIKQERLSQSVQNQICGELTKKKFPDLCASLDKLDIAISFLKSVGSDPESSLHDFMTNTLKMDNPFPSNRAQQTCRCKHAMSWWITLALERTKRQAKYKQVFGGLSDNLKVMLNEKQHKIIEEIISNLPVDRLDVLVALVFECIVLKVDIPQNRNDEDFIDLPNISLQDILISYIEASPYEMDTMTDNVLLTAIAKLPRDQDDENRVLTGHSIDFWKFINRLLSEKQQQQTN